LHVVLLFELVFSPSLKSLPSGQACVQWPGPLNIPLVVFTNPVIPPL
jgi:hypothetical protein